MQRIAAEVPGPGHHRPHDDERRRRLRLQRAAQGRPAHGRRADHHLHLGEQPARPGLPARFGRRPAQDAGRRLLRQAHPGAGAARPRSRNSSPEPSEPAPTSSHDHERGPRPPPPARHDHRRTLPPVLHLRARVSRQGHPDPRRPGERHPDPLHRLRQLRHRLQPERQAGAERHRGHRGAAGRRRAGRRHRRAELPGRVHRGGHGRARRGAARARLRLRARGRLRRRPGRRRVRAAAGRERPAAGWPPPARPSSATCASTIPTCSTSLAPIVSPMLATARVLHAAARARPQDRVRRALHRQEGRDRATSSSRARWTPRSPTSSCGRCWRRAASPCDGGTRTTTSTRPAAASAPSSPSRRGHAAGGRAQRRPAQRRHRERRRARQPGRGHRRLRGRLHRGDDCSTSCAARAASWAPGSAARTRCSSAAPR